MNDHTPRRLRGWADWGISAVNGVVGDYLYRRGNGLAIDMALYHQGRRLTLTSDALRATHPDATSRVAVFVHGLGCNEGTWLYPDRNTPGARTSYGQQLQRDLGYTPFYLRYNTGLAIADNGARLVALLDALWAIYPVPVEDLVLVGHSMGGLTLRVACHLAAGQGARWLPALRHVIYLGTPHDGALLARLGGLTVTTLHAIPDPVTRMVGDVLDLSSQGIKDLARGSAVEGQPLTWHSDAEHHLIAATLASDADSPLAAFIGDGLVSLPAAHAASHVPGDTEYIAPIHTHHLPGRNHLRLVNDPAVYEHIRAACAGTPNGGASDGF